MPPLKSLIKHRLLNPATVQKNKIFCLVKSVESKIIEHGVPDVVLHRVHFDSKARENTESTTGFQKQDLSCPGFLLRLNLLGFLCLRLTCLRKRI